MRILKLIAALLVLVITLISCENQKEEGNGIVGLWEVTKVSLEGNSMTPIARWVRFNSDFTQESGNGWLQHSIGNWKFDNETKMLEIENTNGLEDKNPFKVQLEGDHMQWNRLEAGDELTVMLKRIKKLPTSGANKLFGLWKFIDIRYNGKEVLDSLNPSDKASISFGWDNNYTLRNYPKGEKYGIFKTHGHRQRMQMVVDYNTKNPKIDFYNYEFIGDTLSMKSTNKNFELKLIRIHKFLN